jgi:hypothetical protein
MKQIRLNHPLTVGSDRKKVGDVVDVATIGPSIAKHLIEIGRAEEVKAEEMTAAETPARRDK